MKLLLAFLFFSNTALAIDVGDGSDGTCNVSGSANTQITAARKYYQCTSLDIDAPLNAFSGANAGAGGVALVIKVMNTATISTAINLNGAAGNPGNLALGVKTGGLGGAGGNPGGSSPGLGLDGASGSGSGGGSNGLFVAATIASSIGGGGGGASYKAPGGAAGVDGEEIGGAGSIPGSGGATGIIFGDEATFESTFTGGSGGGAGGGGAQDNLTPSSGSSGGGGGGAIRIIAGGNIDVNSNIIAGGGAGGGILAVTDYAGGGGGGSGGAIWLQAAGDINVAGIISAPGGAAGENNAGGSGFGGAGGVGRIRLDDGDGLINITGSVDAGYHVATFVPTALTSGASTLNRSYASEVSCASVALDDHSKSFNNFLNLLLGLGIASLLHSVASRRSKV